MLVKPRPNCGRLLFYELIGVNQAIMANAALNRAREVVTRVLASVSSANRTLSGFRGGISPVKSACPH